MAEISRLFVTKIYRAPLVDKDAVAVTDELRAACEALAVDDAAGVQWSKDNGYKGYTSYASLTDLTRRDPVFGALQKKLDRHVAAFARELDFDLGRKRLKLDSIWVNVLAPGGVHSGHIHPHSVVSGTTYVELPNGAAALQFEDPRLVMMMAAPVRTDDAAEESRPFIKLAPEVGEVILWESWLRHEVPMNRAKSDRISISFNYA